MLTNEINDILEERQRQKEKAEADGSDGPDGDLGDDVDDGSEDEQDGKDDGPNDDKTKTEARDHEKREAAEEALVPGTRKVLKGTAVIKRAAAEEKERLLKDLFGKDFKADDRFKKAIEQAVEEMKQRRNAQL